MKRPPEKLPWHWWRHISRRKRRKVTLRKFDGKQFEIPAGADFGRCPAHICGRPPTAIIERVLNKALTLEAAQKCGIKVPFTCALANVTELEQVAAQLRFPVVAKPGQKGAQVFRVRCFPTLEMLSEALRMNDPGPVLLQEYCPGVGVG